MVKLQIPNLNTLVSWGDQHNLRIKTLLHKYEPQTKLTVNPWTTKQAVGLHCSEAMLKVLGLQTYFSI